MVNFFRLLGFGALGLFACASAFSQESMGNPEQSGVGAANLDARMMHESFWYSPSIERLYVPGYVPKKTSLFVNPRVLPTGGYSILWDSLYHGTLSGFHAPLLRAQTITAPLGSPAFAYHCGTLGITSKLSSGYPEGKRVVEPVLVPGVASSRKGGILIVGSPTTLKLAGECTPPPRQEGAHVSPPLEK
jgi:hypothetical protein